MTDMELTTLPVLECTQVPVIAENLMDMAASYQAKLDYINTLPRDDAGMKAVKALRSEARKEFEELDAKRKEVKQQVMGPYNKAETIFKSFVTTPFNALDKACKDFSDSVEGEIKDRCEERLRSYFTELCGMKGLLWLKWERLGIKVDLATARLKEPVKMMERIKAFVDRVSGDLAVIDTMEDSAQLAAEYESCLDITTAIQRLQNRRRSEQIAEENRKAREARQTEAAALLTEVRSTDVGAVLLDQQEKKCTVTFTVTATMPMLRALKAWLESKNMEYREET